MRNLEQIQESDGDRTPRGITILLVALGGACIVFAGLAIGGRRSAPVTAKIDPLGELVTQQAKSGGTPAPKATDLSTHDVTFPGILSDESSPTTALAAVRGGGARPGGQPAPSSPPAGMGFGTGSMGSSMSAGDPSSAIALNVRGSDPSLLGGSGERDKLPVVPLPAQNMLGASPVVTRPRDTLTRAASDAVESASAGATASPAGHEGGYQLQVSSFRTQNEAEAFSGQLRARGHKAYVVEAHVAGRGTWYRVRVGPFTSQHAAASYRSNFEGREHVVPFIVPPSK